jgi:ABC-type multidrug transport system ATPase subunit
MASLAVDRTILLSTHVVADLGAGCRQIALLDGGELAFLGSPADFVEKARSRVFEVTVPGGSDLPAGPQLEVVSRTFTDGGTRLRVVAGGGEPPPGAVPVAAPTLEEAYLAFMSARGRSQAARQHAEEEG